MLSYEGTLELPHLPEMVFPKNRLTLCHTSGAHIEFNCLDALRAVQHGGKLDFQVSCAEEWQETRPKQHLEEKIRPYDWTFSTSYQGTLNEKCRLEKTDLKLDIFKLMRKEAIHFYHDLTLFEDELHDHGIAQSSVKIVSTELFENKINNQVRFSFVFTARHAIGILYPTPVFPSHRQRPGSDQ